MARAILGLGSNLGERWTLIAAAVAKLRDLDLELCVSSVYETAPVGGPEAQPAFLNCVVVLETALSSMELLAFSQGLERAAHRKRTVHWGPRTLDVDVLWIDGYTSEQPELTVPHPRMFERAFVLAPLEEVAPDIVDPAWRTALGVAEDGGGVIWRVGALLATSKESDSDG